MTENKWIYCSDHLPKANVPVLVTCLDRAGDLCTAAGYLDLSGGWMIYPFSLNGSTEVIAWWSLPEPAEPKGDRHEQN